MEENQLFHLQSELYQLSVSFSVQSVNFTKEYSKSGQVTQEQNLYQDWWLLNHGFTGSTRCRSCHPTNGVK